jgi:4-hydroxyphenylpyruvate dioxygenase-like putative hemolysin
MAGAARPGICTLAVGGVTFVLVGAQASPSVAAYLETHGQGVQHIAVEVLNAGFARACLADAGTPLLTEVLVDQDGHEQFFAVSEPAAGIQLGFISRTGHRVGVGAENVLALFDAIRTTAS